MSNFVYLANGDVFNMNIEHFTDVSDNIMTPTIMQSTMQSTMTPEIMQSTMTPTIMQSTMTAEIMQPTITPTTMTPEMRTEQQRLDETLLRSQTMEFELNTSIQNANEAANQFMSNLTRN